MVPHTIRVANPSDYTSLAGFLAEGFPNDPQDIWIRRFGMWWDDNPSMTPELPRGWVLEGGDGIAGFFGIIPVAFWIGGRRATALAGTSWYVRPQDRGAASIMLVSRMLGLKAAFPVFINNTPNETAKEVFCRLHFTADCVPYNGMEYWHIFNDASILDLLQTQQMYSSYHRIRMVLRPLLRAAVPLINYRSVSRLRAGTRRRPGAATYACRWCDACDERFTALWEAARDAGTVSLYRDAGTLNWLCFSDPVGKKRTLIACTDEADGSLKGYSVFDTISFLDGKVCIMQQKDIFLPDYDEAAHRAMIRHALDLARTAGVDAVYFWAADEPMNALLHGLFPITRRHANAYLYRINVPVREGCRYVPSPLDPDCGAI